MKMNINIHNLGKIKEANINVRPMTILTGDNGTGKTFFTKTLYSLMNVLNKDIVTTHIKENIFLAQKINLMFSPFNETNEKISNALDNLESTANLITSMIDGHDLDALSPLRELVFGLEELITELSDNKEPGGSNDFWMHATLEPIRNLQAIIESPEEFYTKKLQESFRNELTRNFQISSLSSLVSYNYDLMELKIDDTMEVGISDDNISFKITKEFVKNTTKLSRVAFIESPTYWKIRDALIIADQQASAERFKNKEINNELSGVPQYFLDLSKELLQPRVENHETHQDGMKSLSDMIERELGGEFLFNQGNITFKIKEHDKEIPANLVSFGMTNLGMLLALLKKGVITKGSFVFFDEPETNLHPKWQALLTRVLIKLAKNGVNIVMATHSLDMIKALEVYLSKDNEIDIDKFVSVHHFCNDGTLLKFESNETLEQIIEAREELSSTYEDLYFKGL